MKRLKEYKVVLTENEAEYIWLICAWFQKFIGRGFMNRLFDGFNLGFEETKDREDKDKIIENRIIELGKWLESRRVN